MPLQPALNINPVPFGLFRSTYRPIVPNTFRFHVQTILALDDHPVFVEGDFNRSDQHHFQTWDNFLVQAGLTDVDTIRSI